MRFRKNKANFLDAATAEIAAGITHRAAAIQGLGRLKGLGSAFLDEGAAVARLGRTTGLTRGAVTAFEMDNGGVGFDIGVLRFDDQIEIESTGGGRFSDGGDSGSLIVDADRLGVGLLFAGSDQGGSNGFGLTYANPLHRVLDTLKIDLVF